MLVDATQRRIFRDVKYRATLRAVKLFIVIRYIVGGIIIRAHTQRNILQQEEKFFFSFKSTVATVTGACARFCSFEIEKKEKKTRAIYLRRR